ncbi:MAG: PD40 domain-containing protein [Ardenticatenaceae bacterium]|nr:PD40 domain-containing protein [Ardenticatenaceae bacterium]
MTSLAGAFCAFANFRTSVSSSGERGRNFTRGRIGSTNSFARLDDLDDLAPYYSLTIWRENHLALFTLLLVAFNATNASVIPASSIELVSVSSSGSLGNDISSYGDISNDGIVVFDSFASNLVTGDTNGTWDVFFHDTGTGTTKRVSVSASGQEGNGASDHPVISANGRYIAFRSIASNLVSGDTNNTYDVFVYDRITEGIERVSVSSSGAQGNAASLAPSISNDGRYVAFSSSATNFAANDFDGASDIYVRDRQTNQTQLVSISSQGVKGNLGSPVPAISGNGQFVAFLSYANNLVTGDTNNSGDVFVYNRNTGTTVRRSVDSGGVQSQTGGDTPSISSDGRYLAFVSTGGLDNSGNERQVFVHDSATNQTTWISTVEFPSSDNSLESRISDDGNYVVFTTQGHFANYPNVSGYQIYRYSRLTNEVVLVSENNGAFANNDARKPALSGDGSLVVFETWADNLVGGDTNNMRDIFLWRASSPPVAPTLYSISNTDQNGDYSVSWSSSAGAIDYLLQEQFNSGSWYTVDIGVDTTYTASGRSNGSWCYRVQARNNAGNSSWSNIQCTTVNIPVPPATPTLYSISNSDQNGEYTVSWSSSTGAVDYVLQEQLNNGSWATIQTTVGTSYTASGRSNGSWCYRVQARNDAGNSPWSNIQCTTVNTPVPPAAPTLNSISNSDQNGDYSVSWSSSTGAVNYALQEQFNNGSWTTIQTTIGTSYAASGRSNGSWCYRVQARNDAGNSPWSNIQCTTVNPTTSHKVSGYALDLCGLKGISDILFSLKNSQGNTQYTYSDASGYFQFLNVQPGQYTLGLQYSNDSNHYTFVRDTQTIVVNGSSVDVAVEGLSHANDCDGDALPDAWEYFGYTHTDGVFVNLPAMGADFRRKDVFVEVDFILGMQPEQEAINRVVAAFWHNPYERIVLHVDNGPESIMNPTKVSNDGSYIEGETWGQFSMANAIGTVTQYPYLIPGTEEENVDINNSNLSIIGQIIRANRSLSRIPIFHYGIFGYYLFEEGCRSGRSIGVPSNTFMVTLGGWSKNSTNCRDSDTFGDKGTVYQKAGTFMHELGHNLGLTHGGPATSVISEPDQDMNYKPNYLSVMTYYFQSGLWAGAGNRVFDYSQYALPSLNEEMLYEGDGLTKSSIKYGTARHCRGRFIWSPDDIIWDISVNQINWNCESGIEADPVKYDINGDRITNIPLKSYEDWNKLLFHGGGTIGTSNTHNAPLTIDMPSMLTSATNELDLAESNKIVYPYEVQISVPFYQEVERGEIINYEIIIGNFGLYSDHFVINIDSQADWIETQGFPQNIYLEAGEKTVIDLTVRVPLNASLSDTELIAVRVDGESGVFDIQSTRYEVASKDGHVFLPVIANNWKFAVHPHPTATPTASAPTATASPTPIVTPTMKPIPTSTPTPAFTPSPTPTATPNSSLPTVPNGNFEQGRNVDWFEDSFNGIPLIVNSGLPINARSGSWVAWLGGVDDEISSLSQTFFLTDATGPLYLEFYYQIRSDDACGFDFVYVLLDGNVVLRSDLCISEVTNGWQTATVDLADFVGHSVTMEFLLITDSSVVSSFFIDDVAFTRSP